MTSEERDKLIARGYRRTSNKYGMISRIDREDWVDALCEELRRNRKSLIDPKTGEIGGIWCDWYRRCMSKDTLELGSKEGRKFPTSDWDPIGYIP